MLIDRYAVFGNPIQHSLSPQIHARFAQQTQHAMHYDKVLAPLDDFAGSVQQFFAHEQAKGINITVPFKEQAFAISQQLSPAAQRAQAVNTLKRLENGEFYGDNTDGKGLLYALKTILQLDLQDKQILILGAGGAVRGVLAPLLAENPSSLTIANRTVSKAQTLADHFHERGQIAACAYSELDGHTFDVVINGTSASLSGDLPPLPPKLLTPDACCYDMMYSAQPTPFMLWASENEANIVSDGLSMLVAQAGFAFELWRGVFPDIPSVLTELRKNL